MAFGEVSIDVESRRVRAPVGASNLEPRVFDLLLTLVERPGLTASRDHLIETVWGETDGSDEALSQAVAKLRRALGDDARAPRFIETVPKLGYRWIFEEEAGRPMPPAPHRFEIRKVRMERTADGHCLKRVQVIRGEGVPSAADRAPPAPSSPGCTPPREFVER
jgi:hypothetical protein